MRRENIIVYNIQLTADCCTTIVEQRCYSATCTIRTYIHWCYDGTYVPLYLLYYITSCHSNIWRWCCKHWQVPQVGEPGGVCLCRISGTQMALIATDFTSTLQYLVFTSKVKLSNKSMYAPYLLNNALPTSFLIFSSISTVAMVSLQGRLYPELNLAQIEYPI